MTKSFPTLWSKNELAIYNPEELIDLFLDNTPDGIAIFDMDNRYIRVNKVFTKILGYTEQDVIGKAFHEITAPDIVHEIMQAVKKGKSFHNIVMQRRHQNGSLLDIAASYSPFRNSVGEIMATIAFYRDITDRENIKRELKRTRELYKLITENTTDLILVISKEQKIIYVSPSFRHVFGVVSESLLGRNILEFVEPEVVEAFQSRLKRTLQSGDPFLFQHKMTASLNEQICTEYNVTPILNENNELESFVAVGRNITDRVKNDETIRNLDRLSIIGQLAAGVAHEIRNPLTSLKGFSKLLKNAAEKDVEAYYLSIIMDELDRIDIIVNEFMSLAKPQAIKFEQESLMSILESTVNILHPQAMLQNVQIINHYKNNDIELMCNPHQLKQVFVNFIKNAIEAMPSGGSVHIYVRKLSNRRVQIRIKDEGAGIDTDLMHYLGTPFYTTKDKGIGLGLTVSNKIIQEHNGTMKIESKLGSGTTVKVELETI